MARAVTACLTGHQRQQNPNSCAFAVQSIRLSLVGRVYCLVPLFRDALVDISVRA